MLYQEMGPGLAAHRCTLRSIRGTQNDNSSFRGARSANPQSMARLTSVVRIEKRFGCGSRRKAAKLAIVWTAELIAFYLTDSKDRALIEMLGTK